ncbi:dol-P-Glc:Glc(2)Man(9)GlcNAc(2)-PP-Dol alpha-1,2-glucosyltransferase-like [Raphanus sativus]|uniref:Dol-P-Glc:Glc(2)Man(9)GlcNAc(2)-PP-Dol alpha-1,2-glucosyltransferase n=1 Tax=Raphanus sativus TaxID=3726 RepID=A0A9W3C5V7_RAPSA|nr:dol-P-Glc:Glc(2)Man(9)GlcNAc(2)-PP-Dol alpha-1,2-glucosyltransferase-like [Raphanus sativus]
MGKLAVAAITSLWVIPMSIIVNHIVPNPYMDEIFHVPQAQQYCNGNFRSWDPMITTPPGLYYLSLALAHVASLFPGMLLMRTSSLSFSEACSTSFLRSINAVFAVLCGVLSYEIIRFLGPSLSDRKATLMALVMYFYPLHWFFTFLYYTDVSSLTAFLAMYLACLRKRYTLSALHQYCAKEAHLVSPHFAQIMYFSLVSALFTAPFHFSVDQLRNLLQELRRNWPLSLLLTLVALIACFASVHFFSLAHPYLLADNRHYPFYLWRKIINAHWLMKYMLVPVYVYSWFSILTLLAKARRKIWVLVYFLATCAVLVPTPLIEFRYYTIPFYIFMLHSCVSCTTTWLLTATVFICINVYTMAMFLFRPFEWSHEDGVQRFIW